MALIASSAALVISGAPFMGPIGAARVGFIDGDYVLNPTTDQVKDAADAWTSSSPRPTTR